MKNLKELFAHRVFRILKWAILILVGLFIILVIFRTFHYFDVQKTSEQITKIHATKITLDDVMGVNLPKDPGEEADKTVQGIDSNNNGIRDDVELAIFNKYPDSAKTRAVLLQYALSLQMMAVQPFVNEEIATEVITEQGRADTCLSDTLVPRKSLDSSRGREEMEKIDMYISFVEQKQLNIETRKVSQSNFYDYLRSYGESKNLLCDVDLSKLPN